MPAPSPAIDRERTPLLYPVTPTSVSQHHKLLPPTIHFPPQHGSESRVHDKHGRGPHSFNNVAIGDSVYSNASEETLTNETPLQVGRTKRAGMVRDDSKVYTSFPRPFNSEQSAALVWPLQNASL